MGAKVKVITLMLSLMFIFMIGFNSVRCNSKEEVIFTTTTVVMEQPESTIAEEEPNREIESIDEEKLFLAHVRKGANSFVGIVSEEAGYVETIASDEEVRLIALVTMAEAEGESEEGKRLVIDTILNRVDSNRFPDTISDVIFQPSQFSSMWNGRVDRCVVKDDIYELVLEELESRTNHDVLFFTSGGYGRYGTPLFKVGNHYFGSY